MHQSNKACTNTPPDFPPTTPTNLVTNAVSPAQIDLSWNASTDDYGVIGYNVNRDGTYLRSVSGTSDSDIELYPDATYCYTVSAYDAVGNESAQSNQACVTTPPDVTPPTSPTNLVTVPVSTDQISLSWNAATDDGLLLGYKIYRDGMHLQDTTATSFSDTGLNPNTQYCYAVSGYDAGGNESALSARACTVTSWTITLINGQGFLGLWPSIAVDSTDKAHVSYYENISVGPSQWIGELRYATNASGSWIADTIDSPGYEGGSTSIALDSTDNVHISFIVYPLGGLKYTTNASGIWLTETIDTNVNVIDSSIAIDSENNVHISYNANANLKYITNALGVWASQNLYSIGVVTSGSTSIALDSTDNVHISFLDYTNGDLKYFTDSSGSWVVNTIDSVGDLGVYSSIAVDAADNVHISYYDSTNGDLKYATNTSGIWVTDIVDSQGDVGEFTSIAVDSAHNVHISYYDSSNESLKYAANSSGIWERYIMENGSGIEGHTSIAVDSTDKIHIIYQKYTSLKYATNR
jgi:chitodextrinase